MTDQTENLTRKRGAVKAKLTAFLKHLTIIQEKIDKAETITKADVAGLKQRTIRAETLIDDFEDIQIQLEIVAADMEQEYVLREEFEKSFYDTLSKATVLLSDLEEPVVITDADQNSVVASMASALELVEQRQLNSVKLPIINLPKFSGAYHSWLEFRDTFVSLYKLDEATAREWEKFKADKEVPTLEDLKIFLKSKADLLETLETCSSDKKYNKQRSDVKAFSVTKPMCINCEEGHFIYNCPKFIKLDASDRVSRIKELKACLNCLRRGHFNYVCKLSRCKKCNSGHHSLLHVDAVKRQKQDSEAPTHINEVSTSVDRVQSNNLDHKQSYTVAAHNVTKQVLLSTAYVHIVDKTNKIWSVRALLDNGSQASFITERLYKKLSVDREDVNIAVAGLNHSNSHIKTKCEATIQSLHNDFEEKIKLFVIPEITGSLPNAKINVSNLAIPTNIKLADPPFYEPGQIDVLIGADLFWKLICVGQIELGKSKPILQKTKFGWIVSGAVDTVQISTINCNLAKNLDIQEQLAKFWDLEEVVGKSHNFSNEGIECENHFQKNTQRMPDGRFEVQLPLREPASSLGNSYEQAKKRFLSLERKLRNNIELKQMYSEFMSEYESLGHISEQGRCRGSIQLYYRPGERSRVGKDVYVTWPILEWGLGC